MESTLEQYLAEDCMEEDPQLIIDGNVESSYYNVNHCVYEKRTQVYGDNYSPELKKYVEKIHQYEDEIFADPK